ncbi:DUF2442 domain-containing protein [Bacteroidales bacterium OttesenSCG-928-K03]|nr:DUF2442 domain-containing protein [Bacteroidales bacterium OttesenSCG-928-K22]MDL2242847.1 DUF2442 domain-containing protein [Bacteroidales bacterium OttesenSCG-928-K03]
MSPTIFGFWILCDDKEYFINFNDYPDFRRAPLDAIFEAKFISPKQIRWPSLDIDIEIDALKNPEIYPLQFT